MKAHKTEWMFQIVSAMSSRGSENCGPDFFTDEMIAACRSQLEAVPATTLTRSFYTQRILSIVANVKKQNEEMKRVLEDVKSIQREINGLQGKVDRIYTITDEMIFQVRVPVVILALFFVSIGLLDCMY